MNIILRFFNKYYKFILLLFAVGVIIISPLRKHINVESLISLIEEIKNNTYAPLVYVGLYIVGVVFAVPGAALTVLAGPLFGFRKGALLVVVSANLGCQLTFLISRFMGRDFVKRFIREDSFVDKISKKIENNGFLVMLYLRLLPIFPFNVVNYVSGLTDIKHRDYTLANLIGMLPGTIVYVYLSVAAVDVKNNPVGLIISVGLLILFTAATAIIKRKQKIFK